MEQGRRGPDVGAYSSHARKASIGDAISLACLDRDLVAAVDEREVSSAGVLPGTLREVLPAENSFIQVGSDEVSAGTGGGAGAFDE